MAAESAAHLILVLGHRKLDGPAEDAILPVKLDGFLPVVKVAGHKDLFGGVCPGAKV